MRPPERPFLPALKSGDKALYHCFNLTFSNGTASAPLSSEHALQAAWESRRCVQTENAGCRHFRRTRGEYRWRMPFSSAYRGRWRSHMSSTSLPTTSRISTPPATSPTTRCSSNTSCRGPATKASAGPDRRVSYVEDRASWIDMSEGAIQHTGNPLDVAIDGKGYPRGAERERTTTLHAQRRAFDQCRRSARNQRRRSGGRQLRADHFSGYRSRRGHQPDRHHHSAARAKLRPTRRAAIFSSSISTQPQLLQKDGGSTFMAPAGVTPDPAPAEYLCWFKARSRNRT